MKFAAARAYLGALLLISIRGVDLPRGSKYPIFKDSGPKTAIKGMVFGTRNLKCWVLGPSGLRIRNLMKGSGSGDMRSTWTQA